MKGKERISYWANPALGLFPFLIYALLVSFLKCQVAMSIVLGLGLGAMLFLPALFKRKIFPFFLFISNAVFFTLLIFSSLLIKNYYYDYLLPDLLVALLVVWILLDKHRFIIMMQRIENKYLHFSIKPSLYEFFFLIKLLIVFLMIYVPIVLCYLLFMKNSHTPEMHRFLLGDFRFMLILLLILFSHVRLYMLNRRFQNEDWLPIIDEDGSVIGKIARTVSYQFKEKYLHPHIRILVFYKGRIFLRPRDKSRIADVGGQDTPLAQDLFYSQDFPAVIHEMMLKIGGNAEFQPRFFTRYLFERQGLRRMVFLYTLIIPDEDFFSNAYFRKGKLWTEQEVENNIGKGVFAEIFEEEYELLRNTIFPVMKMMI